MLSVRRPAIDDVHKQLTPLFQDGRKWDTGATQCGAMRVLFMAGKASGANIKRVMEVRRVILKDKSEIVGVGAISDKSSSNMH